MALRTLWTGHLRIGLVAIPVKLYSATRDPRESTSFKQLHDSCLQPIAQRRWCDKCQAFVDWEHVVKGREVSKGNFVAFTEEELRALEPEAPKGGPLPLIEVVHSMLDPVPYEYVDTPYWMVPEPAGKKAFATMWSALLTSERQLLCKVKMRTRPRLCVVRAQEMALPVLELVTVRFSGEIVDSAEASISAVSVEDIPIGAAPELKLARRLLRELDDKVDFRRYADAYGRELAAAVDKKVEEKASVSFEELLKRSVEEARKGED